MKKIYIILTHTGTALSRLIKYYTKDEFSHCSIALDDELKEMYSFGRLNSYNPFWGGFLHEDVNRGTFKRFKNTIAKIYFLEVTDEQYEDVKNIIGYIEDTKEMQNFNVLGMFAAGFNRKVNSQRSFYCAEFVKYVLDYAEIGMNLPDIIKPEDFKKLENIELVYEGKLKDYNVKRVRLVEQIINNRRKEVVA